VTGHELAAALLAKPDLPVTVAGVGPLALVTHASDDDGQRVIVLYVLADLGPDDVPIGEPGGVA
jgi:hypothetical protein